MQLSVPTMLVTTIVSAVLVSMVLPFARRRREAPGIREATASALCFAGSCVLILLKDHISPAARIVPSNGLLWMGFALQWLAYARFDDRSARAKTPLGLTAGAVGVFALLYAAGADYRERAFYASAMVAMLSVASIHQLMRDGGLRRERSRAIGVALAGVTIACQAVRVPLLLALPSGDGALLSGTTEQAVAFFPAMVHVLGVGLGFLVMHVERTEAEAQQAALTDPLTGCANRRAFAVTVTEELARFEGGGEAFAVLLTDIDRFKAVNDTHGHAAGDEVIRAFAEHLTAGVRAGDTVARLGGEEFCVLVRGADASAARGLAERLGQALREQPARVGGTEIGVTASFGVAVARKSEGWEELFGRVDRALYAAKSGGRDRVVVEEAASG